jgi:hypothetical protein
MVIAGTAPDAGTAGALAAVAGGAASDLPPQPTKAAEVRLQIRVNNNGAVFMVFLWLGKQRTEVFADALAGRSILLRNACYQSVQQAVLQGTTTSGRIPVYSRSHGRILPTLVPSRMFLRISPVIVAAALICAHFFRAGSYALAALCLVLPLLLLYRSRWSLIVLQCAAYAASLVWITAALELVQMRQQMGRPWTAAAIILGTVALFTVIAGLLLNARSLRQRYSSSHPS